MSRPRVVPVLTLFCVAALGMGCGKRDAPPVADSSFDSARSPSTATQAPSDWSGELGQLLIVPSDSDNVGVVLYPEDPSARLITSAPLTLLNAGGDTTRVKLVASDSQQCGDAPVVRLTGAGPASWTVGLLGRSARLLRMDSIETLTPADSARLAADLARLASALDSHKNSRFSGLPFSVMGARRFEADGRQYVAAHLARRLNQEALPLEEHTFLIAERPAHGASPDFYVVTYTLRSEGSEDTAEHFETLASAHGRESLLLLLARDQLAQTTYEVLERSSLGKWRSRWSRKLVC